jgi:hypothetical protein
LKCTERECLFPSPRIAAEGLASPLNEREAVHCLYV